MSDSSYKWLESARLLRQKTQKDAAAVAGISQGKLSKAERGDQTLPDETLRILADYYDVPFDYFFQEWDSTPIGHVFFRRRVTISSKIIDSISEEIRRRKCAIDELLKVVDLPEYDLGFYPLEDGMTIEKAVSMVRYKLKCINGPLTNLAKRLENHGIIIQMFDFGTDKMDGVSTVTGHGRKIIFLNSLMSNDRIRFSLAHELGHMVLHIDDIPGEDRDVEEEANNFASQLLMPANEIKPQLYNLTFNKLMDLKQRWCVSMRALVKRAVDLNTMNLTSYRNFQINFSKKGYTKMEPGQLSPEPMTILDDVIKLYKSELGYSEEDLMKVMVMKRNDYYSWFSSQRKPMIIRLNRD